MRICFDRYTSEGCGRFNRDTARYCCQCGASLGCAYQVDERLLQGRQGSYRLIQGIGGGGFGIVYRAENINVQNRVVAIKESFCSEDIYAFQDEFAVLQELHHPNLPRYYEMFESNNRGYLVMEFVPGQSLLDILKKQWGDLQKYYELGLQDLLIHLIQKDQGLREQGEEGYLHYNEICNLKEALIENMKKVGIVRSDYEDEIRRIKILDQIDQISYSEIGEQFEKLCQRNALKPEPIPQVVLSYMLQLCDVLGFLHKQDIPIIHRDIKPANIRLTPEGVIKLVDFGLFKKGIPQDISKNVGHTEIYASPEQVKMEGGTGSYSDIYSLGATFYHLLTWQTPPVTFKRLITPSVILRSPRSISRKVPPSVSVTILKSMALEKDHRYQDIAALKQALFCRYDPIQIFPNNVKQIFEIDQFKMSGATKLACSPNSHDLAILSSDTIKIWDTQSDECRLFQSLDAGSHTSSLSSLAFSPDGQILALASDDGAVKLLQVSKGEWLWISDNNKKHTSSVADVTFAPDGELLASASDDGTIKLWQVSDGTLLQTLQAHENLESSKAKVSSIAFDPDGQILASASWDMSIKLWHVSDGHVLHTLWGHEDIVWNVAFAPNGQILASASQDKTVKLWRVSDGELINNLEEHESSVESLVFTPDGQIIISASHDKTLKLWLTDRKKAIHTLYDHTDKVRDIVFASNGYWFATVGDDATVRLWRVW